MEIDGYAFIKDDNFIQGECYWVYRGRKMVGWLCMFCGIIRITHCETKESLGSPFLVHELYGDAPIDEFPSGKDRRTAFRRAVTELKCYYGNTDKPKPSAVEQVFGIVEEANRLPQMELFSILN